MITAFVAQKIEALMMRCHLIGQHLVSYSELKAMFGGGDYPDDVWRVISRVKSDTKRDDVVAALRDIANRNGRGAVFADAIVVN